MKNVLVVVASRHGSTAMFGDCIREELEALGHRAHVQDPALVTDVRAYDAVVLGSAVYGGRWLKPARRFAERVQAELRETPVWLFSSGPVGDPLMPVKTSIEVDDLARRLHAVDHRVFAGRLTRESLGVGERLAIRIAGGQEGDYRPWPEIAAWARGIADALTASEMPAAALPASEFGRPAAAPAS